jgi:hypothetical protein
MAAVPESDIPDSLRGKSVPSGDLPGDFAPAPAPTIGEKAGAYTRGLATGALSVPGETEKFFTQELPKMLPGRPRPPMPTKKDVSLVQPGKTLFPTQEEVSSGIAAAGFPESRKEVSGYEKAGRITPDIAMGGYGAYQLGKLGIRKAADLAKSLKKPAPLAEAEGLDVVGEKGFDLIKKKAEKLYDARRAEAETKYGEAFDAARAAQAQGEPFATSNAGKWLMQTLENEKTVLAGGKEFARGEEKIAGINRLIKALEGKTTGGFTREAKETPAGKKIFRVEGSPKKTTEKDIEAIVEELRFLRDVDAKGKPYEAYASLDANYKRDLIEKLEKALYSWNPEYKAADEAYKLASRQLDPFKTQLMSGALKGEKFDPKSLVASPEEFGAKFFSDVDGVRQLKAVTQDANAVKSLSKEYVASMFTNKSPTEIKAFVANPKNTGWMKEAGILDDVTTYANQAKTAESRQEILKKLGYAAAGGALVGTLGSPLYYGTRRALGF